MLISVHLQPNSGAANRARRGQELAAIASWIDDNDQTEHDFIILGDMNIQNCRELEEITPAGFVSMNDGCLATNTNVNGPRPYDHVMFAPQHTGWEIDHSYGFWVIDLIEEMRSVWDSADPYPGDPYIHNTFRQVYSDHHPIAFRLRSRLADDD